MKQVLNMSVVAVLLCGCASSHSGNDTTLDVPGPWKPSHSQNGTNISALVRVFGSVQESFPDPKSGKQVFQCKAHILKAAPETGELVLSGVWAYLLSSTPLEVGSVLRISGQLSVSEHQVKGGAYPATIRLRESKKEDSNKPDARDGL